jgi:hypothetical protein
VTTALRAANQDTGTSALSLSLEPPAQRLYYPKVPLKKKANEPQMPTMSRRWSDNGLAVALGQGHAGSKRPSPVG